MPLSSNWSLPNNSTLPRTFGWWTACTPTLANLASSRPRMLWKGSRRTFVWPRCCTVFEELLKQLALGLDHAALPYMVFGGQAVLLYGEPRLTRDIDITLGTDPSRLNEVLDLVKELQLKIL